MIDRRKILKAAGFGMALSALPGLSVARAPTDARFVLVILRGAADGLALVAPYGDGNYRAMRGALALPPPGKDGGLLKLDGLFGLHPSLQSVHDNFRNGQATILHAIASPYRKRSHFDGQDVLENGGGDAGLLRDGWLNRALAQLQGSTNTEVAVALAQNAPLVLRGPQAVMTWAPSRLPDADDSTIARLQDLYADDEFFASRLAQAIKSEELAAGMDGMSGNKRRGNYAAQLQATMTAAARFLAEDDGPRIAVVETGGWDTHANQGSVGGALANRLSGLDAGLTALQANLGESWQHTVVTVVTEFGRTVRVNGTRGTDHGTATAAMLLGGAVKGGNILADWPGLASSALHEDRDLRPTTDVRSLFKGILADHLALPSAFIEREVFPDSAQAVALRDLVQVAT